MFGRKFSPACLHALASLFWRQQNRFSGKHKIKKYNYKLWEAVLWAFPTLKFVSSLCLCSSREDLVAGWDNVVAQVSHGQTLKVGQTCRPKKLLIFKTSSVNFTETCLRADPISHKINTKLVLITPPAKFTLTTHWLTGILRRTLFLFLAFPSSKLHTCQRPLVEKFRGA